MVVRTEKLLRNDNLILTLMRKGFNLGNINLAVDIDALGLFRKHDRNAEMTCHNAGNANTGCLNGNDLVDRLVRETALELLAHLIKQVNIHLMVQKTVYLQNVAFLNNAILGNSFL